MMGHSAVAGLQWVEEAAHSVPIENLVIHLRCGFALTYAGNLRMWDDQRCMQDLVVEASQQIGGETPRGVLRWTAPIRRGVMP